MKTVKFWRYEIPRAISSLELSNSERTCLPKKHYITLLQPKTIAEVHSFFCYPSPPCDALKPSSSSLISVCNCARHFHSLLFDYFLISIFYSIFTCKQSSTTSKIWTFSPFLYFIFWSKNETPTNPHFIRHCSFVSTSSPDQEPKALPQPLKTLSFSKNISPKAWIFSRFLNEMLEQKIRAPKNRGFYVRMKLLPSKHGRSSVPQLEKKSFFYRNCKWVLWLSLSFYFFSSYLISNHPNQNNNKQPTSLSKTHFSSLASRALFESTTNNITQKQGQ